MMESQDAGSGEEEESGRWRPNRQRDDGPTWATASRGGPKVPQAWSKVLPVEKDADQEEIIAHVNDWKSSEDVSRPSDRI